jgi:hypothetical protein
MKPSRAARKLGTDMAANYGGRCDLSTHAAVVSGPIGSQCVRSSGRLIVRLEAGEVGCHCQCMNSLRGKGHFSPKKLKGYEGWAAQQDEQPSLSEALRRLIETG